MSSEESLNENKDIIEDIKNDLKKTQENIKIVEDYVILTTRRTDISEKAQMVLKEFKETTDLINECYAKIENELPDLLNRSDAITLKMQEKQLLLMNRIIKQRQRKLAESRAEDKILNNFDEKERYSPVNFKKLATPIVESTTKNGTGKKLDSHYSSITKLTPQNNGSIRKNGTVKKLEKQFAQLHVNKENLTPIITMQDYLSSPFVKQTRRSPIPIKFFEFELQLTAEKFNTIPKYMRGRETFEELKSFLDYIINCFNEKYELLHRKRSAIRNWQEMELWRLYNEQKDLLPNTYFITPDDISRKSEKMLDKKSYNRITMLRHLGILREERVSHTVCYIWAFKKFM